MVEVRSNGNMTGNPPGNTVDASKWSVAYAIGSGLIGLGELLVGWMSGSLALIADSIHSITDLLAGLIGAIAAAIAKKKPDDNHPFGHSRAEPLGAFMVAVLTAVLGLNVIQMSVANLVQNEAPQHGTHSYLILAAVLSFKGGFYLLARTKRKSTMLRALSIDSRNDCLASMMTLVVIYASTTSYPWFDQAFALVIGGIILYSGFHIAKENVAMLMGEIPDDEFFEKLHQCLDAFDEVRRYDGIRAHYVGPEIHLALTIRLDRELSLAQAHQIEHRVISALSNIPDLSDVFIHIEPFDGNSGFAASQAKEGKMASDGP